jgi:hypothetical protein
MNQAEASRRIERLEEDVSKIEIEMLNIQHLLVQLNAILHGKLSYMENEIRAKSARRTNHSLGR